MGKAALKLGKLFVVLTEDDLKPKFPDRRGPQALCIKNINSAHPPFGLSATGLHSFQEFSLAFWSDGSTSSTAGGVVIKLLDWVKVGRAAPGCSQFLKLALWLGGTGSYSPSLRI